MSDAEGLDLAPMEVIVDPRAQAPQWVRHSRWFVAPLEANHVDFVNEREATKKTQAAPHRYTPRESVWSGPASFVCGDVCPLLPLAGGSVVGVVSVPRSG